MALFAISDYILATGNYSLATRYWGKIESAANFIVYLQQTPEPGMPFTGMYRHGDNWLDSRIENMQDGTPVYWPYWPEYYHWEEENMRMIMGLRGAISLAENLGYKVDARVWNASVSLALLGLANENKYNKFETYDYFGSVLWGIQSNMTLAKRVVQNVPADLLTGYGLKDLPWENYASSPDTIDYMVCLARIGDLPAAEHYLNLIVSDYSSPSGGFYGSLYMNGSLETSEATVFASARFLYFASVANSMD